MSVRPRLRVPVGPDAKRWRTFDGQRVLVVAVRTLTSAVRVLEFLPELLRGDDRVTVVFAHDPGSAFDAGVTELLAVSGCRTMPWEQVGEVRPDLILTASENLRLPEDDCPVLVLPHGVGFHKWVPDSETDDARLSGLVPERLLERGRAWLAVSHPDQERQLLRAHPGTAGHTLLLGDPCYDRLLVSRHLRESYRRALGVADGQRLVVLSSTWGAGSLIGADHRLPERLLAQLPYDDYRVAAILHPNVWAGHGRWQVRTLLGAALAAGLLLVPPTEGWQQTLLAADLLVGDAGSVTLYGAALELPLLLAAFGAETVPGTPMAELGRAAPRLDPDRNLRAQVEHALAGPAPQRYARAARRAFAEPGHALPRLRSAVYRLLRLAEPPAARHTPPGGPSAPTFPSTVRPEPEPRSVTSSLVHARLVRDGGEVTVTVERRPAVVASDRVEGPEEFRHLASHEREPDPRLVESASVVTCDAPPTAATNAVAGVLRTALDRWPGALLTVAPVPGGCLLAVRNGPVVHAVTTGPPADPGLPAAAVHAFLCADLPLDGALLTLRCGPHTRDLALRVRP